MADEAHQRMVRGSSRAPSSGWMFTEKVPTTVPSLVIAAAPRLSMECRPGMGPSASTSTET